MAMDNDALGDIEMEWIKSAHKEMKHGEPDLAKYLIRPRVVATLPATRAKLRYIVRRWCRALCIIDV